MLGILRGSLVTACQSVVGDFSDDAKVKLRRTINEEGPAFCQLADWAFLHTTVTFNITDGDCDYSGAGYFPLNMQRMLAAKIRDDNNNYAPIEEKPLAWYERLEDPTYEGTPGAVTFRGLDSSGYPVGYFYYCPDDTYMFEGDFELGWTDVSEAAGGDTTRIVITQDCYTAFKYWVARAYAILQGDDNLIARCNEILYGNRILRIPGVLDMLLSKQRGARKRRRMMPSGAYKDENRLTTSDYGRKVP